MGLWIRTQDKKVLFNANYVAIDSTDGRIIYWERYVIATYSTDEKALKVVKMIQDLINKNESRVFQMPEDSEVKE